jgi:hypothetical protein
LVARLNRHYREQSSAADALAVLIKYHVGSTALPG